MSFTVITKSKEVLPPRLLAVTLYVFIAEIVVGVPEIVPVVVFNDNPDGKLGETE